MCFSHVESPATWDTPCSQAKLHNGADILVVPHGANFGNIIFNSAKSVVVHVSADEGGFAFPAPDLAREWHSS